MPSYLTNYVCFPCRKTARKGRHRPTWHTPHCPGCGHEMLRWNSEVPGPKDWDAVEKRMVEAYLKAVDNNQPSLERRPFYADEPNDWYSLFGRECAPPFFANLAEPTGVHPALRRL